MRTEKWGTGDFLHLIRRGGRGLPIVREESDYWRYLKVLFYLNDTNASLNTISEIDRLIRDKKVKLFEWPSSWKPRKPLFSLCAFVHVKTHEHEIGLERIENGISRFMHKSGISISKYHNDKYQEKGSLFEGPYKASLVDSDAYLRWVVPYVMVKNTFEMHPRGYDWAKNNFEEAWQWAIRYPFSSLGDYAGLRNSPIVDTEPLKKLLGTPKEFKQLCRDMVEGKREQIDFDKLRTFED